MLFLEFFKSVRLIEISDYDSVNTKKFNHDKKKGKYKNIELFYITDEILLT